MTKKHEPLQQECIHAHISTQLARLSATSWLSVGPPPTEHVDPGQVPGANNKRVMACWKLIENDPRPDKRCRLTSTRMSLMFFRAFFFCPCRVRQKTILWTNPRKTGPGPIYKNLVHQRASLWQSVPKFIAVWVGVVVHVHDNRSSGRGRRKKPMPPKFGVDRVPEDEPCQLPRIHQDVAVAHLTAHAHPVPSILSLCNVVRISAVSQLNFLWLVGSPWKWTIHLNEWLFCSKFLETW